MLVGAEGGSSRGIGLGSGILEIAGARRSLITGSPCRVGAPTKPPTLEVVGDRARERRRGGAGGPHASPGQLLRWVGCQSFARAVP
jgi:hypothetical protein